MAIIITIAAKDVKPGDRVYNPHGYCAAAQWVPVQEIRRCSTKVQTEGGRIVDCPGIEIKTNVYNTVKSPRQRVVVQRELL